MTIRTPLTILALLVLAACGGDSAQSRHATDGDTGQAAPGTVLDDTARFRPDSTTGVAAPAGRGSPSGVPSSAPGMDTAGRPR